MDTYVASLQPLYAKLAQQPGALEKVTRRIARAEVRYLGNLVNSGRSPAVVFGRGFSPPDLSIDEVYGVPCNGTRRNHTFEL